MRVAISQSNYIPWRGYFDLIASVDIFVVYDNMQYTRRDWRNRNKIKTPNGDIWLTVPVDVKGKYLQKIYETKIIECDWNEKHLQALKYNYKKSKHFKSVIPIIENLYLENKFEFLSDLNIKFIKTICEYLGINTEIVSSRNFILKDERSERLASICSDLGATKYISAPAARDYLTERIFDDYAVSVEWFEYINYPEYTQLWGEFIPNLSIIDLILNEGKDAKFFMKIGKIEHE